MFKKRKDKRGYTLVEIIAAIVILGILILIAVPAINKQLNNFRINYYKKLEKSVVSASQDYVVDRRYSKPTKLFHSRVIKVSELEKEGYIDEVKDYLGKSCDNTDTSYSYVVVVKTGEKEYDYTTCLKCSQDEYATDTTGKRNNYCDNAWMSDEYIEYELNEDVGEKLYVYYGTNEESIKDELRLTYDVIKKNNEGEELARKESDDEDDALYPQNIGELVGKNVNQIVNLRYVLPDGATMIKESVIYKHNEPKVEMYYGNKNIYSGKEKDDVYENGSDEWADNLIIKLSYSDSDIEEVRKAIAIKDIEYYDANRKRWVETNCTVSDDHQSCTWDLKTDFEKEVKFRIVNERDKKGDGGDEFVINVDTKDPSCVLTSSGRIGDDDWYIDDVTFAFETRVDALSGIGKYDITDSSTQTFNNNSTAVLSTDYKTKIYYGHVVDKAGNTKTCDITVKRDATAPTCSVNPTGTKGTNDWFTSDVAISLSTEDITSEVNSYDLSKSTTPTYGNAGSSSLKTDTTGTMFYGYVKDNAGNVGKCEKNVKRDTVKPSCSISKEGTLGTNDWYTSNVSLKLSTSDETSKVDVYDLTTSSSSSYENNTTASQTTDTKSQKFYGYVKDNAGLAGTCDITVKKDTTAPTKPVIDNPTNGEWSNVSFSLTVTSNDTTAGIDYWYYSYDQSEWTKYDKGDYDSYEKTEYITSPFSKERESLVYIKACDKAGHCSTNSTWIRIDKTEPTCEVIPTGNIGLSEWFIGNVNIKLDIQDNGSEIETYGLSETSTVNYNKTTELNLTSDTKSKTYYGFVKDTAGNSAKCQVTVKRDTQVPGCIITPTGNQGTNNWFTGDVSIALTTSDATSTVLEYDLTTSSSVSYKKGTSLSLKTDTTGQKYYAYVKDKAGLTNKCEITVKRDTAKPSCEIAVTGDKGNNNWYIGNVGFTLNYEDATSQVKNYDLTNSSSATYTNSKKTDTLTTDTASKTYYGYVKDDAGHAASCNVTVKRDTKAPSCTITPTGTAGDNGWFRSDVDVNMTYTDATSQVKKYGMSTTSPSAYNSDTAEIVRKDTTGITYYGKVEDDAGHTSVCELTVKRDATAPRCSINPTGTKGNGNWFIGDVTIDLTYDDATSQVNRYDLTTSSSVTYGSTKKLYRKSDTTGLKYYGYVKDEAGNTNTCDLNIYRDTEAPTCTISTAGTVGENNWFISDVNITLNRNDATSKVAAYDLTIHEVATYNDNSSILLQSDTTGTVYHGYVKDNAGLTGTCQVTVKRDVAAPTCEIQVTEGTEGNNGWYKSSSVKLTLVPDDATKQHLTTSTTASYGGTVNATITSDTKGTTYHGYVKDDAGQTGKCSITIKKDSTAPTCELQATGTTGSNGWFTGNVSLSFKSKTDATSDVATYDLTKNSAATFNKGTTGSQTDDTTGQTFYGHVRDNAGNVGKCELTVKKDVVKPVCYIEPSGAHSGDWFTGEVVVALKTVKTTSNISTYGIKETSGKDYNEKTSLSLTSDTPYAGKTYYGYVKSEAGLEGDCTGVVKRDATAPAKPSITNPSGGWTNQDFALTVSSSDGNSGLGKWYYSYTTNNASSAAGWNEYANSSGVSPFTTTKFSAERNQLVYIKVCDVAGNCSVDSTMIQIDKTAPTCTITPSGDDTLTNGWYNTDILLTIVADAGGAAGIVNTGYSKSTSVKNYEGSAVYTKTLTSDFDETYYYGHIQDDAGNEAYCQTTTKIKRDATKPSCSFKVNSNDPISGWYTTSSVIADLQKSDARSDVASFATKIGSNSYSNGTYRQTITDDTNSSGVTVYGTVTDNAGNTETCSVNIKKDTVPPTCSITASATSGTEISTGVFNGNIKIQLSYGDASYYTITTSSSTPGSFNNDADIAITSPQAATTYYGHVKDQAGNVNDANNCKVTVTRVDQVTITFNKNSTAATGSMSNQTCSNGVACTLTSNGFSRTGYSFGGWATSSSGNVVYANGASATLTANTTLYAKWNINQYTLTINPNGGTWGSSTSNSTASQNYGTTKTIANPTRTGYTFDGWTLSGSGSMSGTTYTYGAGDGTLTAKWKANTYTISYTLNSGTNHSSNPSTYTYGTGVSSFYEPTRANYKFEGWYTDSGFTSSITSISKTATGDKTLYAKWSAIAPTCGTASGTGSSSDAWVKYREVTMGCTNPDGTACSSVKQTFTTSGSSVDTSITIVGSNGASKSCSVTYYKVDSIVPTPTKTGNGIASNTFGYTCPSDGPVSDWRGSSPSHIYRVNVPATYSGLNASASSWKLYAYGSLWNQFNYGSLKTSARGSDGYYGCVAYPSEQLWWFGRWSALSSTVTITVCSNAGNCDTQEYKYTG